RLEHDKQWLTTAPNGNVLLCWDRDPDYTGTGSPSEQVYPASSHMVCAVSKDKGKSWTTPTQMNQDWPGFLPAVDYNAANIAVAAAINQTSILFTRSADGLSWTKPVKVGDYKLPAPGGEYGWPVLKGSAFRIVNVPFVAADRTSVIDGYSGSIYITWFDYATGDGEVRVAYSRDVGATWAECARPADDDPALKADQFYPTLSVGPDGTVDLSWWDRRDDPNNHLFHVYYTYSKDGCRTWAPNLRVTDVPSDEQYSRHQNGMIFLGDYRDQDSSMLGAHLVWVDTRNQKADVYTAIVQR
ncbi:MAG TPA: sialidase family protein, partial [Candidatus Thermoplasmatota archaeon]|nr:sialidase family protein [Candidatus Thermoplasmatota archaeon]